MWTPKSGTRDLSNHFGHNEAFVILTRLLSAEVTPKALLTSPYYEALCFIGNGHAKRLLREPINTTQLYWTQVWAARSLAYLGDEDAYEWLVIVLSDTHWRVRMMALQALGQLKAEGLEEALTPLLEDGHERVRAAAAIALGRTGNEFALEPLEQALDDEFEEVRAKADRALAKVEKRVKEEGR